MEHNFGSEGKEKNKNNQNAEENVSENTTDSVEDEVRIDTDLAPESPEEMTGEEQTVEQSESHQKNIKTIKNLISAVIIISGVAAGSFFVDIVQFVSGRGYSEKALKDTEVFVAGDKTWVAYQDPAVEVEVLTVSDEELENCKSCDPAEVLLWLKRFIPTLVSKKVVASTPEGESLINQYDIKSIPAFVFSKEIENSEFYESEASVLFDQKDDKFVLNSTGLGVPVGKFIEIPQIAETDPFIGNQENPKVTLIAFMDFQCPYCKEYFNEVTAIAREYQDELEFVFKDLPLDFHPRSEISAIAARCAQDQDKFWEMGGYLYENQDEWANETGTDIFKGYARTLGLDTSQFNDCIDEKMNVDLIEDNIEEAEAFGVSGTPATFINQQFISGIVQGNELKQIINDELEKQ